MVSLSHLTKKFAETVAVSNLNLNLKSGEIFGFLGPNGAGKTTTLKLIAGLLRPTEGTIEVCGYNVQKEPERVKSLLGYVPDNPFIYEALSGREFLWFVGGLYRMEKREIEKRIAYYFEVFGINNWADASTEGYSHGMRQKIVLISALFHNPKVIIIDEPMVGLDPQSAHLVREIFKEERNKGKTIFLSTHTLSLAETICDRIGIINKGKLIALGMVEELRQLSEKRSKNLEELYFELTRYAISSHQILNSKS
ncbi:MAG: ABC transporter ATP-binding protein [Candidatus Edwardsbacteria bacterium]